MQLHKYILSCLMVIALALHVFAQESQAYKHAVVLELGGNGLVYSLNYEHHFTEKLNAHAGFSFWRIIENQTEKSLTITSYPVSANYLFNLRHNKHFLETGIGAMNLVTSGDLVEYKGVTNYYLNPFVNAGYRFEPEDNRMVYKVGLSPFLGTKSLTNPTAQGFKPFGSSVQLWGYLGVGYTF